MDSGVTGYGTATNFMKDLVEGNSTGGCGAPSGKALCAHAEMMSSSSGRGTRLVINRHWPPLEVPDSMRSLDLWKTRPRLTISTICDIVDVDGWEEGGKTTTCFLEGPRGVDLPKLREGGGAAEPATKRSNSSMERSGRA